MATLTDKQAALFRGANFGNVATIRDDGTPHVTPIWVDYDDGGVLFNTAVGRAKERHLRRDPRLSIGVFDAQNPYEWVEVTGTAEFVEDGAHAHIDNLAKKYLGVDTYPYRTPEEVRVIVRVQPTRVSSSSR